MSVGESFHWSRAISERKAYGWKLQHRFCEFRLWRPLSQCPDVPEGSLVEMAGLAQAHEVCLSEAVLSLCNVTRKRFARFAATRGLIFLVRNRRVPGVGPLDVGLSASRAHRAGPSPVDEVRQLG